MHELVDGIRSLFYPIAAMMFDVNVKSVLITGTTSGVGRALLEHYAQNGVKVISVNRRRIAELDGKTRRAGVEQ